MNKLSGQTAGDINDSSALIWFTGKSDTEEETKKTLLPLAKEHIEKYKDTEQELIFYYATDDDDDDDIVDSLRDFCSVSKTVKLAIISIPQQCVSLGGSIDV